MEARLVPLELPDGWVVTQHVFPDVPFDAAHIAAGCFPQDLFQASHEARGLLVDLGCIGELEPSGTLLLRLFCGDFRGELLHEYETRSATDLIAELFRVLQAVEAGAFDAR